MSWINLTSLHLSVEQYRCRGCKRTGSECVMDQPHITKFTGTVSVQKVQKDWVRMCHGPTSHHYIYQWNNIGAEGAKGLSQNVSWTNLTSLDLLGEQYRCRGCKRTGSECVMDQPHITIFIGSTVSVQRVQKDWVRMCHGPTSHHYIYLAEQYRCRGCKRTGSECVMDQPHITIFIREQYR